jgi:hypothetical protein
MLEKSVSRLSALLRFDGTTSLHFAVVTIYFRILIVKIIDFLMFDHLYYFKY